MPAAAPSVSNGRTGDRIGGKAVLTAARVRNGRDGVTAGRNGKDGVMVARNGKGAGKPSASRTGTVTIMYAMTARAGSVHQWSTTITIM